MSYIRFNDVSVYQGDYNMADGNPAVAIKMGGGDAGLYMDSKANLNYGHAVAAGKVPIGYWFAGGTDPIAEADYFLRCMAPLAENDVYALDWEVQNPDPVGWCTQFVNHIHDKIGVWPLVYMNMSTANAHDWSPVFNNCGYWCAAPSFSFDATLPVKYPQVAQQGPIVNGVDTDAFFGSIEDLKKYGYQTAAPAPTEQAPVPVPVPNPAPEAAPSPAPEPTPAPVEPVVTPTITIAPAAPQTITLPPQKDPVVPTPSGSGGFFEQFITWLLNLIKTIFGRK